MSKENLIEELEFIFTASVLTACGLDRDLLSEDQLGDLEDRFQQIKCCTAEALSLLVGSPVV